MSAGGLLMGMLILSASLYGVYRVGVWLERRHKERCFMCGSEVELGPRKWVAESHYWDSANGRWSHMTCKLEQVQQIRKAGGI